VLRRLSYYFLLVVSLAAVAASSYVLIMSLSATHGVTRQEYIVASKLLVGLIGVSVAVNVLWRDRDTSGGTMPRAAIVQGADNWIAAFIHRPLLAAAVGAFLLAIPLILLLLARGWSLRSWTRGDWIRLALAEIPAVLIGIVTLTRIPKRSANQRLERP
jgi:hypothetical protein